MNEETKGIILATVITFVIYLVLNSLFGLEDFAKDTFRMASWSGWDFGDYMMVGILGVIAILLFGLVWYGVFWTIDTRYVEDQSGSGTVTGKGHSPAHTTFIQTTTNNATTFYPVIHPETWSLTVEVDEMRMSDSIGVAKEKYKKTKEGDRVSVLYRRGRFSGGCYITSVAIP